MPKRLRTDRRQCGRGRLSREDLEGVVGDRLEPNPAPVGLPGVCVQDAAQLPVWLRSVCLPEFPDATRLCQKFKGFVVVLIIVRHCRGVQGVRLVCRPLPDRG